jgi:hypothetical protein
MQAHTAPSLKTLQENEQTMKNNIILATSEMCKTVLRHNDELRNENVALRSQIAWLTAQVERLMTQSGRE